MFDSYLSNLNQHGSNLIVRIAIIEAASHFVYRYNEMFRLIVLRELFSIITTLRAYEAVLGQAQPGRIPLDTTIEGIREYIAQCMRLRCIYGNWVDSPMTDGPGNAGFTRLVDPEYSIIDRPVQVPNANHGGGPNSLATQRSWTYMGSQHAARPAGDRGEDLTSFLLMFYVKGTVSGYDNLIFRKTGFITRRFQLLRKDDAVYRQINGLQQPEVNEIQLAAGMILVIGTHRAGKTTTVAKVDLRAFAGAMVNNNYDRLPINEPDAISGNIPEASAALISVINRVHDNNRILLLDSLTSLSDVVTGNLKTGGINWGIFLYMDALVQFSFWRNFVVTMSIEEKEFDTIFNKFKGRIPNIFHVVAPGRVDIYVRGSSPNEPVVPDRRYEAVLPVSVALTPFNIV